MNIYIFCCIMQTFFAVLRWRFHTLDGKVSFVWNGIERLQICQNVTKLPATAFLLLIHLCRSESTGHGKRKGRLQSSQAFWVNYPTLGYWMWNGSLMCLDITYMLLSVLEEYTDQEVLHLKFVFQSKLFWTRDGLIRHICIVVLSGIRLQYFMV